MGESDKERFQAGVELAVERTRDLVPGLELDEGTAERLYEGWALIFEGAPARGNFPGLTPASGKQREMAAFRCGIGAGLAEVSGEIERRVTVDLGRPDPAGPKLRVVT